MKFLIIMSLLLMRLALFAQQITPIERGMLYSDMNGNNKSITNLQSVKIGNTTIDSDFLSSLSTGGGAPSVFDTNITLRVTALEETTNTLKTVFSWGSHAGLYKSLGWQPSWNDITDKPTLPTAQQIADWDTAAGWGPHATAGYLKSATDTVARTSIDVLNTGKVSQAQWLAGSNSFATATQGELAETAIQTPAESWSIAPHNDNWVVSPYNPYSFFTYGDEFDYGLYEIKTVISNSCPSIYVPESYNGRRLTAVGASVWQNNTAIFDFNSGPSVILIGQACFKDAINLSQVIFGKDVRYISSEAFRGCISLSSVYFRETPDTETVHLGDRAFYDCANLNNIYFSGPPPGLGADVFTGTQATIYHRSCYDYGTTFGGRPTEVYGPQLLINGQATATLGAVTVANSLTLGGEITLTNGVKIGCGWSNIWKTVILRDGTTNLNIVIKAAQ